MDAETLDKLEFPAVRELLASRCGGALGRALARRIQPSSSANMVRRWLGQVRELQRLADTIGMPPIGGITDIRDTIRQAGTPAGAEAAALAEVGGALASTGALCRWCAELPEDTPLFKRLTARAGDFSPIAERIDEAIDERGAVRDNASPKLASIRATVNKAKAQIDIVFSRIIRRPSAARYLRYANVTLHNDRKVLPLKAEHRGRIGGIIHRSSDSGATLFVEPTEAVELNNTIVRLRVAEHKEVTQILRRLSGLVHMNRDGILRTLQVVAVLDVLIAKVRFAHDYQAVVPAISEDRTLEFRQARHPVLETLLSRGAADGVAPGTAEGRASRRTGGVTDGAPGGTRAGATDAAVNAATNWAADSATHGAPGGAPGGTGGGATNRAANSAAEGRPSRRTGGVTDGATGGTGAGATDAAVNAATNRAADSVTDGAVNGAPDGAGGRAADTSSTAGTRDRFRAVVPIDVRLGDDFDVLVITGPNTGGKTVAIKTIGLLAMMAQSGIPIPVLPGSTLPVYRNVFVDIGDEQSIEQSLSTFSSHLSNILGILRRAGPKSLVLIDELGAGTDPDEGAAIGRAVMEELLRVGASAAVTTHLSALKAVAYTLKRVDNASVEFDPVTLRPAYRLRIGEPGNSNALIIARRLGMPKSLIKRARRHLDSRVQALKDAIAGTLQTRRQAERARADAQQARLAADRERLQLQQQAHELEEARRAHDRWVRWIATLRAGDEVHVRPFERNGRIVRVRLHQQTALVSAGAVDLEVALADLAPPNGPA